MGYLEQYREIVGDEVIALLYKKARKLNGKHIVHINSTHMGGGVAEMLVSLIPLMNELGIDTGWRVLHGNPDFFQITKSFHNGLQGESISLNEIEKKLYTRTNEFFSSFTHLGHDLVIVHDPQPLALIDFFKKHQPWLWRCHIDLSHPNQELWDFFKRYIIQYDRVIVSNEIYKQKDLPIDQHILYPAIDPLSSKNKELSEEEIGNTIKKYALPTDKPIITQISRFDKWKDPEGVIDVYKRVKETIDCRLILCGSMASDDPEGIEIYERVRTKAQHDPDIILLTIENNILVNVLQRISSVLIQKSLKEGFGLTVTEALWKGTPIVASNIGGIPVQITDGVNGFLLYPNDIDGFANKIIQILQNPDVGASMAANGKETVKKYFLMTRLLSDYLELLSEMLQSR
ncbi:MAG: glycosyl transferase family 1 [Candidatus Margulisiibacteriota bacterium]|nr:MAG: glycosyl transferase family 1 [Candidatus Margulisbacteria bacterium GWD2_39_127]OGI03895.1 MAG: glycosyl transferase family 1 [Candidatus Margulisbacteria bacterium GWF2_38_17]OGI08800.1 MAG: glycosyl transferase family 1 [Candidatus Margulisbacteria bacterium GWE2_39_32]PZM78631.1 MAG: glycosyl transferase family 1 [Candidatus Margulisiibacteriota bacterium]HAR61972.1 glycosyl transferase family 1 [Candidatus Margulisiibacteriota bacterium]